MEDSTQKAQATPYGAGRSSVVQIVFVEFVTKTFPLSRDDSGGVVLLKIFSFFRFEVFLLVVRKKRCGKDKVPEI